jgi:streptogramin lyase
MRYTFWLLTGLLATVSGPLSCQDDRDPGVGDGGMGSSGGGGDDGDDGDEDGDDDGDDGGLFDVGEGEDGACPEGDGDGGIPDKEFSHIWIANSAESTVSKIDTREGIELARYKTAPGAGNPSRTSVNLYGDVAVMNREGKSVAKIAARLADCNGLNTSEGPQDVKPFGEDDCMVWWKELPASGSYEDGPRPVAWEGVDGGGKCDDNDPRLWVAWGSTADSTATVRRLDGRTGDTLDEVTIPGWTYSLAPIGPYGGAANKEGDFWIVGIGGPLARIHADTLAVDFYPRPNNSYFYGIALDAAGKPWLGDLAGVSWRFDTDTDTFLKHEQAGARGRGIMLDREQRAWMPVHANPDPVAGQCSLAELNGITGAVVTNHPLPGCMEPVGVAIDADGFVWIVDKGADSAYKVDPDTGAVALTVTGLNQPYTYSDMTGSGLDLVVNPPQG